MRRTIPALARALVACGWFGIQTWLGALALDALMTQLWGGWTDLGWHRGIAFAVFWAIQVAIILRGMEGIKILESCAPAGSCSTGWSSSCANPAKLFGLYPRKGTIAVGSDADLVVFDPERRHTITAAEHHSKVDSNLYEGTEVTGSPELVLRGHVLVEDGRLAAKPGVGQFVERARFGEMLARGTE